MSNELRILILEDDPNDVELEIAALEMAGYSCQWDQVMTRDDFLACLSVPNYDLVLSDYSLPSFDGLTALKLFLEREVDIPFILVSGMLGEEVAIESLKAGATDYVLKNRLARLVPVVERALKDNMEKRKSQRGEAERKLLSFAIEQAAEVIVITDSEGIIQYVNPAFEQITGYTRDEAIGQNPRVLKSNKQDDVFYKEMWETLTRGETWSGLFINKKKDGSLYTEDAVISPVRNTSGQTVNYVAVKRDITEQKKLEGQLRQSEKLSSIGQLAGGVAHDYNNNLAIIMGFASILKMKLSDEKLIDDVDMILKASKRSSNLVKQLLAFARKRELETAPVNLHQLINEVVILLKSTIDKRVTMEVNPEAKNPVTIGDHSQLENAFLNIAINAGHAMPDGGVLTFFTRNVGSKIIEKIDPIFNLTPGPYIEVTIRDTGIGMDSETLKRIYEPFFTTKDAFKGTGLGLSAVFGSMKSHKGAIVVDSKLQEGTTFKLYFPQGKTDAKVGVTENQS